LDNGSTDRGVGLALYARSQLVNFPLILGKVKNNKGFGQGFNHAVKLSTGRIIYLVSDDVKIFGDFIVEPRADEVICQRIIEPGAGWNDFPELSARYPEGYFLVMERDLWDQFGGFDKRYKPYDFEDVDLGMTVAKHGKILTAKPDLPIRHLVAGTIGYTPERMEHTIKMRAKFAEKWELTNEPERP
jgi:GT2 family glycosyltransferase